MSVPRGTHGNACTMGEMLPSKCNRTPGCGSIEYGEWTPGERAEDRTTGCQTCCCFCLSSTNVNVTYTLGAEQSPHLVCWAVTGIQQEPRDFIVYQGWKSLLEGIFQSRIFNLQKVMAASTPPPEEPGHSRGLRRLLSRGTVGKFQLSGEGSYHRWWPERMMVLTHSHGFSASIYQRSCSDICFLLLVATQVSLQ